MTSEQATVVCLTHVVGWLVSEHCSAGEGKN